MVYQIDFIGSIYANNFYDYIIPQMGDCIRNHYDKELIFNFIDLEFLSPNIVPNLLNVADLYKRFTNGRAITLQLSWNPKLLSYLYSVHFFYHADNLNLFRYNREMLGGFDSYSTKENCNLIFSGVNSSEDEIMRKVEELMRSKAIYRKMEKDYKEDCENLETIFFQLIHNANDVDRGNSNAYGLFQINKYETGSVAYISICDGGGGISYTLNRKFQKNKVIPFFVKNRNTTTFYYILEALYWRRINYSPLIHGLYNVSKLVLRKGGKIGIHSNDMHVLFPKNFRDTFESIARIIERKEELDQESVNTLNAFARRNTLTRKYEGVHIDIEIPIGERK